MEEAIWRVQDGVDVPIPTRVLRLPLFGKMALVKAPVEVAQRVSAAPPPDPQAVPVLERVPEVLNWAQPVAPPSEEKDGIPLALILKTDAVEVAKVDADDVAR